MHCKLEWTCVRRTVASQKMRTKPSTGTLIRRCAARQVAQKTSKRCVCVRKRGANVCELMQLLVFIGASAVEHRGGKMKVGRFRAIGRIISGGWCLCCCVNSWTVECVVVGCVIGHSFKDRIRIVRFRCRLVRPLQAPVPVPQARGGRGPACGRFR